MRVSILGTNGFLSTAIAVYCNDLCWNLDMYGLSEPEGINCDNFYKVNLLDSDMDVGNLKNSDMVIYAVGAGIQSNLKEGFAPVYNLNVNVPVNICNRLKAVSFAGVFVTFGSYFEIGETKESRLFDETDVMTSDSPAPNDYIVSKRMLTRFVSSYKHDFTHWHFILPTIYGENENPLRLIPYTINGIRNSTELHFTSSNQTRQYIHVSEIPRMLDMACTRSLASGVYNVGGNETVTVKEIVELIHREYCRKVPSASFGTAVRTDTNMCYLALDGTKLRNLTGFQAAIAIKDVIRDYESSLIRRTANGGGKAPVNPNMQPTIKEAA